VTLPEKVRTEIATDAIDNWSDRRILFSTAAIQEQLINCCCEMAVPVTVESVVPADGHRFSAGSGGEKPQRVTLTFDKDLKTETVTDDSILVYLSKDNGATRTRVIGKVTTPSKRTAVFIPDQPFLASSGGWDYIYTVTAKGNGSKRIRDVDGLALDGDKNGVAGGDFKSTFKMTISA
jgi:Bacterial Ig-like domain